jgi:hypothetical protein
VPDPMCEDDGCKVLPDSGNGNRARNGNGFRRPEPVPADQPEAGAYGQVETLMLIAVPAVKPEFRLLYVSVTPPPAVALQQFDLPQ